MSTWVAHSILLDAHPFSLYADDAKDMQPWAEFAHRTGSSLYVSTATLVETFTGSPSDANIHRALRSVTPIDLTPKLAASAGGLRSTASSSRRKVRDLTLDSIVAASALTLPAPVVVLTGDPGDLGLLLDGTSVRIEKV